MALQIRPNCEFGLSYSLPSRLLPSSADLSAENAVAPWLLSSRFPAHPNHLGSKMVASCSLLPMSVALVSANRRRAQTTP
jgi:hypothetical protein